VNWRVIWQYPSRPRAAPLAGAAVSSATVLNLINQCDRWFAQIRSIGASWGLDLIVPIASQPTALRIPARDDVPEVPGV